MKYINFLFAVALLILTGCQTPATDDGIDETVTRQVLDRHWETFVANDLDGVMEDYRTYDYILV